jgi:hypothetical protein
MSQAGRLQGDSHLCQFFALYFRLENSDARAAVWCNSHVKDSCNDEPWQCCLMLHIPSALPVNIFGPTVPCFAYAQIYCDM